jgi:cytoskeleton protein RodZ
LREVSAEPAEAQPEPRSEEQAEPELPRETVGTALREARIARGEDSATVARLLKMRREQLEAIETCDLAKLPGRTYAVGFVRSYARHLGLDAEAMVQRFKDETTGQDIDKPVDLVFPKAREEYRAPGGSIVVLALGIATVIYGISYVTVPGRKQASVAQAEEAAVIVEAAKPAAAPAKAAPALGVPGDSDRAPVEVAVSFVAGKNPLPDQAAPEAALPPVPPAVAPFAVAEAPGAAQPAAQPASRINLKAVEPTYIQIRDPKLPRSRSILIARVLNVGESYSPPDRVGLIMQTGNAGGLQVEVDGRSLGVMGRSGEVITRVPLDASYFLERMAATQ